MSEIEETFEMIETEWTNKILQQKESEVAFLTELEAKLPKTSENIWILNRIENRIKQLRGGRDE